MQQVELSSHSTTPCAAVSRLTATIALPETGWMELAYELEGDLSALRWPTTAAGRHDDLWQHTCFEAFVMPVGSLSYREFNLAPPQTWACYDFTGCRTGMHNAPIEAPLMHVESSANLYRLRTRLPLPGVGPSQVALAVVLEHADGLLSYWAVHHPSAEPDFHDPTAFTLQLG